MHTLVNATVRKTWRKSVEQRSISFNELPTSLCHWKLSLSKLCRQRPCANTAGQSACCPFEATLHARRYREKRINCSFLLLCLTIQYVHYVEQSCTMRRKNKVAHWEGKERVCMNQASCTGGTLESKLATHHSTLNSTDSLSVSEEDVQE
jgi:hypothetical protein